jgi:2',3'-cyclic-nucleotide 2'-phosphodiesterase (5'-nucleotidase family)
MRRFALLPLAIALLVPAARPALAEEARVTILHTTDVHGSLLPWDDLAQQAAPRGLARAATLVARVRAEGPPVLLLDDGDATAGSPLTTVWRQDPGGLPEPVTRVMNAMGYDAMALGNHEFDFGPAGVDTTRASARFPVLAANVVRADGMPAFPSSLVKTLPNGVRVGVIGLCTPAVPQLTDASKYAGYRFVSPFGVTQTEVTRLRGIEHCDVVVVLAHTGLEQDPKTGEPRQGDAPGEDFGWKLAKDVKGIDVVILGHTHVVVPGTEIGEALVTQAGKAAEHVGRVDLTLTRASSREPWTLASRRAQVIALGDSTAADTAIVNALAPYEERTMAALDEGIATAPGDLSAPAGRLADNALWQLVHRAQMAATGASVSLAALFDPAQVIPAGPVRVRDVMRLYPYDNSLVVVKLSGAQLHDALEQSARFLAPYTYEDGHPLTEPGRPGFNFDMAMGVQYTVDLEKPPGERVSALTRNGQAIGDRDTLAVVVNGYRAAGGGDFAMIARAPRVSIASQTAPEAVIAYARATKQLPNVVEPSWTLLPGYAGLPERPLLDRLVRLGVASRADVRALGAAEPATRGDVATWIARAFAWRGRTKGGSPDALPDSVEALLAGAIAHGVPIDGTTRESLDPARPVTVLEALNACENAARAAHYAMNTARPGDVAYWRGLLTGTSLATGRPGLALTLHPDEHPTRAQLLGLVANLRFPQIRVLETTDFHGAILGGAKDRRSGRAYGGTTALAAWIEHERGENPEGTVLLDGGDIFQGTMISNLQFGRPVVEQMDLLQYTAAAIGNHDFDWNADTLYHRVMGMRFAALGANIVERKSGRRPWWMRSDTTFARRGLRVSVLGLAYPGTPRVTLPANVAHLRFEDDSTTAAGIVPRLRKAGADVVLAVGHIPAETDSTHKARGDVARLARGVPGVDAWLGGHSHNVVDDRIDGATVMIAGANGQYLAVADLTVDPVEHAVVERRQKVMQLWADQYPPDSAWIARVQRWNAGVDPIASEVIGRCTGGLTRHRPEASIGDFICEAMKFASGADIAMQNPGGMRADLPAGEVTRGAIYQVMPFDNTIVTLEMTGADVKVALEQGLRGDRVTQVAGIRYAFDSSRPPMQRLTAITLADGSPLDDAKTYRVAVNNFMATGGDNYDALNRGQRGDGGILIRGAMEAWVRDHCKAGAAFDLPEDGRIRQAR